MSSTSSPLTDDKDLPRVRLANRRVGKRRGLAPLFKQSRAGSRLRRKAALEQMDDGIPSLESLKPVFMFLAFPAMLVLGITVTGGNWPTYILYPIALAMGAYVAISTLKGMELILAVLILYLPFSPVYVIPLAPGINGTNALIGLGLFASIVRARTTGETWVNWLPGTTMVLSFAFITTLSAVTILFQTDGYSYLMHSQFGTFKGWVDQFIVYIIAIACIRDRDCAKRVFIYLCIGSILVVIYSLPEMYQKMGRSTIEKSRLEGPLKQSNDFGGFVAYTLMFTGAIFLSFFDRLKAWVLTPYFLIALKVLISTFSRGAYLALALGGFMAAYFKGKGFLIFWATIALCGLLLFPQLVPESVMARMGRLIESQEATAAPVELDKSSQHRLILWKAALDMIQESPIQGKGFKGFAKLKAEYTESPVHETDPHNYYLYVASQMGVPALLLFICILLFAFHSGRVLGRDKRDRFVRAMGIAGAAATATYAGICMFGSRAVNPEFTGYFWVLFVCLQVMREKPSKMDERRRKKRSLMPMFNSDGQSSEPQAAATGPGQLVAMEAANEKMVGRKARRTEAAPRRNSLARKKGRRRTNAFDHQIRLERNQAKQR